jgi:hypothetical protein
MSFAASSQTIDTTCTPTEKLRQVITDAKMKPVLEERITILNDRISNFQMVISNLNEKDSITIAAYEKQIQFYMDEKKIYEDQLKGCEKLLRKEKRAKKAAIAGGVLATGIMAYLYLTK